MALSTIGTAAIADDAITAAKIDDDGTGFTFGDVTTGALTATGATTGIVTFDKLTLDGSSVATVTVNSAVSSSATVAVDGVSGTIAVGMVVNVSDTTVRSIIDASSETAVSVDDTLTITAVASQTSFTVSEAVSIADNVVLILRADESSKMVLDASAASTDVGDEILFEDATADGSVAANNVAPTLLDVVGSLSNTMTTKSEGGAVSTNIAQGLSKAWGLFNGIGTISIRDSFNITGITDAAVGKMNVTINNDMASVNYQSSLRSDLDNASVGARTYNNDLSVRAAGSCNLETYSNSADEDHAYVELGIHGDLA